MGNFLKANQVDTSALSGALPSLNNYANQVANNAVALGMPVTADLDPGKINNINRAYSNLNYVQSRQDEANNNPQAAAARKAFEAQTTQNLNGLDATTQRGLANLGITGALNSGLGIGPGSTGQSQIANIYGRGANQEMANRRAEAENLYGQNAASTGIGGENAANLYTQQGQNTANSINTGRQTLMNAANAMLGNTYGQFQQGGQMAAQTAANNAAAHNQAMGMQAGLIADATTGVAKSAASSM